MPCLVLGFVLGDIVEKNFHRMLTIGHGSVMPLVTRPASLILLISSVAILLWPYISPYIIRPKKGILKEMEGIEIPDEEE